MTFLIILLVQDLEKKFIFFLIYKCDFTAVAVKCSQYLYITFNELLVTQTPKAQLCFWNQICNTHRFQLPELHCCFSISFILHFWHIKLGLSGFWVFFPFYSLHAFQRSPVSRNGVWWLHQPAGILWYLLEFSCEC